MKNNTINFTKAVLNALPIPPAGSRPFYWDSKTPALAVRVFPTGTKNFYFDRWANDKHQRLKIGRYPDMTIDQARTYVARENAAIAMGNDPSAERARKRAELMFRELFDWYLEAHAKPRKRSWNKDVQNYRLHLDSRLGTMKVSQVTKSIIRETHVQIRQGAGPYAANRVLSLISVMFNKAIEEELFEGPNPAAGIRNFPEEKRERRLNQEELGRVLQELAREPNETARDYFLMLIYSGVRRSNVLAMRWEDVDLNTRVWRIPETKSGKPQNVPLLEAELGILRRRAREAGDSVWVFPGRSDNTTGHLSKPDHAWKRILDRAEVTECRIHDLRRTFGSLMADSGTSLHIVGKALHHQDPKTTEIYARLDVSTVRAAKDKVHEMILSAGRSGQGSKRVGAKGTPKAGARHGGGRHGRP